MSEQTVSYSQEEYDLHLKERERLIDAAREGSRTFDKAVLTFASAVFGFSIAFLKDVAPHPVPYSLCWLGAAWLLFSLGLLLILLSFLFSHKACLHEIDNGTKALGNPNFECKNRWSTLTNWCNFLCVALLFLGLLCWSRFAFDNLGHGESTVNKIQNPSEKKGYIPPPPPRPAKSPQPQNPPPPKK